MRIRRHIFDKIDWWTILLYIIFIVIGWLNVYAALYNENYNLIDFSHKYGRQLIQTSGAQDGLYFSLLRKTSSH